MTPKQRGRPKEEKVIDKAEEVENMEVDEKEEAKEDVPQVMSDFFCQLALNFGLWHDSLFNFQVAVVADKKPVPVDLPEEELKKLAGKTVKKGEDEYVIVVQGVDSGLCGKYWGDLDNLPSRQEQLCRS